MINTFQELTSIPNFPFNSDAMLDFVTNHQNICELIKSKNYFGYYLEKSNKYINSFKYKYFDKFFSKKNVENHFERRIIFLFWHNILEKKIDYLNDFAQKTKHQ